MHFLKKNSYPKQLGHALSPLSGQNNRLNEITDKFNFNQWDVTVLQITKCQGELFYISQCIAVYLKIFLDIDS